MKKSYKSFRGLTLMEAMLFLGLAAIVAMGVYSLYGGASGSTKLNQARTQLQTYVSGVKSLYASQTSYSSVDSELMIDAGIAPTDAIFGTELHNPWGGLTTVAGDSTTYQFTVSFDEVPREACLGLLSSGLISQGTVFAMGVGTDIVYDEVDPGTASTMCSSDTDNEVVFIAR